MMNPTVEALLVLQERDARVTSLLNELEHLPRQLEAIEAEIEARREKFEALRAKTRLTEAERKKIDLDVQSKRAAIARYRAQQTQTRKNEEFAALNHEIEHAEKEISALEDTELELMEAYDNGLKEVAAGQRDLALAEEKAKQKRGELEKRQANVAAQLSEAKAKQAEAEGAVDESVLGRYRRILKSKRDVAVVPIQHGACAGCHMKLTTQTVVSARSAEALVSCENCGRIVYPGD
jgi:predicted  nucleic acid-binding Zn-ribbon protein